MIPKIIHLCWFSDDPFPVEIKICLDTWKRILPDYKVRRWTYQDAKAIGCQFIDEALKAKKWAFAADVVRFYAVYNEGGIYMDSDIFIKNALILSFRNMDLPLSMNILVTRCSYRQPFSWEKKEIHSARK